MTNDEKLADALGLGQPGTGGPIPNRPGCRCSVRPFVPAAADIDGDKSLEQLEPEVQQARAFLNTPEARVLRALYLAGVLPADVYVKAIQIVGGMR